MDFAHLQHLLMKESLEWGEHQVIAGMYSDHIPMNTEEATHNLLEASISSLRFADLSLTQDALTRKGICNLAMWAYISDHDPDQSVSLDQVLTSYRASVNIGHAMSVAEDEVHRRGYDLVEVLTTARPFIDLDEVRRSAERVFDAEQTIEVSKGLTAALAAGQHGIVDQLFLAIYQGLGRRNSNQMLGKVERRALRILGSIAYLADHPAEAGSTQPSEMWAAYHNPSRHGPAMQLAIQKASDLNYSVGRVFLRGLDPTQPTWSENGQRTIITTQSRRDWFDQLASLSEQGFQRDGDDFGAFHPDYMRLANKAGDLAFVYVPGAEPGSLRKFGL